MNPVHQFIADDCVLDPRATVFVVEFHGQLQSWWRDNATRYPGYSMHSKWVEAVLTSIGIGRARAIGGDIYIGVAINSPYSHRPPVVALATRVRRRR